MAVNFKDLLGKSTDEVKRPPNLLAGHYFGKLGKFTLGDQNQNHTPYVRFSVQLTGLGDDVDAEEFAKLGIDLTKKQMRQDFFLTEDAEWRLKEFLTSCGLEVAGRTFGEILPETPNCDVILEIGLIPATGPNAKDGEMYNRILSITGTANSETGG